MSTKANYKALPAEFLHLALTPGLLACIASGFADIRRGYIRFSPHIGYPDADDLGGLLVPTDRSQLAVVVCDLNET